MCVCGGGEGVERGSDCWWGNGLFGGGGRTGPCCEGGGGREGAGLFGGGAWLLVGERVVGGGGLTGPCCGGGGGGG